MALVKDCKLSMKSSAPLPPVSHKKGSKESIPSLMDGKTIVFNHDALVYVLKERNWSPVIESYVKLFLVLTEPKMYRVMVWDAQNLVIQCVVDASAKVKTKDTFVKWKSESTTMGARFTSKDTANTFYQHLEEIVGMLSINEKKSFNLNVELPSGKTSQIKVFSGMKLSTLQKDICTSAGLDPDKYRLVDLHELMTPQQVFVTEEFSKKSLKIVEAKSSLQRRRSVESHSSNNSTSEGYPGDLFINLEDSNWRGFFNIANIQKTELNNSEAQAFVLSFVKDRGGYSFLRKVNDHKISHNVLDDLNDLAGQVHAINDRSEVVDGIPKSVSINTIGSLSNDDGKKNIKRRAPPPPPENKAVQKSKVLVESTSNCTSPKLHSTHKRQAPSIPSSPTTSISSMNSTKVVNFEQVKTTDTAIQSPKASQSHKISKKSTQEGDKPPPMFVPPPPPHEPPPDDASSPGDESHLLIESSTTHKVEANNACMDFHDDQISDDVSNSDINDTEKDVSAISDEIFDFAPALDSIDYGVEPVKNEEVLSKIVEVSEISDAEVSELSNANVEEKSDDTAAQVDIEMKMDCNVNSVEQQSNNISEINKELSGILLKEEEIKSVLIMDETKKQDDSFKGVLQTSGSNDSSSGSIENFEGNLNSKQIKETRFSGKNIPPPPVPKKPPNGLYSLLKIKATSISDTEKPLFDDHNLTLSKYSHENREITEKSAEEEITAQKVAILKREVDSSFEYELAPRHYNAVRLDKEHINQNHTSNGIILQEKESSKSLVSSKLGEGSNIENINETRDTIGKKINYTDPSCSISKTVSQIENNLLVLNNSSQSFSSTSQNDSAPDMVESNFHFTKDVKPPNLLNSNDMVKKNNEFPFGKNSQCSAHDPSMVSEQKLIHLNSNISSLDSSIPILHQLSFDTPLPSQNVSSVNKLEGHLTSENVLIDDETAAKAVQYSRFVNGSEVFAEQKNNLKFSETTLYKDDLPSVHLDQKYTKDLKNKSYDPDSLVVFPDEINNKSSSSAEKTIFDPVNKIIFTDLMPKYSESPKTSNPWRGRVSSLHKSSLVTPSSVSKDSPSNNFIEAVNSETLRSVGAHIIALDEVGNTPTKTNYFKKNLLIEKDLSSETNEQQPPIHYSGFYPAKQNNTLFSNNNNDTLPSHGLSSLTLNSTSGEVAVPPLKFKDCSENSTLITNNMQQSKSFSSSNHQTIDLRSKDQEIVVKKVPPKTLPKRQISTDNNVRPSELARISQMLSTKN